MARCASEDHGAGGVSIKEQRADGSAGADRELVQTVKRLAQDRRPKAGRRSSPRPRQEWPERPRPGGTKFPAHPEAGAGTEAEAVAPLANRWYASVMPLGGLRGSTWPRAFVVARGVRWPTGLAASLDRSLCCREARLGSGMARVLTGASTWVKGRAARVLGETGRVVPRSARKVFRANSDGR